MITEAEIEQVNICVERVVRVYKNICGRSRSAKCPILDDRALKESIILPPSQELLLSLKDLRNTVTFFQENLAPQGFCNHGLFGMLSLLQSYRALPNPARRQMKSDDPINSTAEAVDLENTDIQAIDLDNILQ